MGACLDGVSIVADVGPQVNDVGDELLGHAWKYDTGERRREAHAMRALVFFPAAGRVDLRYVGVASSTAVSFDQRHIDRRAGAQEDREDVRMSNIAAGAVQTPPAEIARLLRRPASVHPTTPSGP